jgi:hypothetical protein
MFMLTYFQIKLEFILMPIYIVFPKDDFEIYVFTSYSAMEQFVLRVAKKQGSWCKVTQYDGTDQLMPTLEYDIHSNLLNRRNACDSVSTT